MKVISLLITLVFLFSFGTVVLAQEIELPDPGLTPDSPFYFLETIAEDVVTFFTFGDLKKAERYASLAAERIAEAKDMVEKGKPELVEKPLKRYKSQLNKSMNRAEQAMFAGKDFDKVMGVIAKAGKTTSVHLEALTEVYEKVPEQTKTAVESAMGTLVKRHEKAVEALKGSNTLGEIPEEIPISTKIPQEARDRIQMRAEQELEIEKALEGLDTSKSLRALCTEQGGPPEACEKLPSQSFKSFKQVENFCTEMGGPSEVCASFESMCREFGVTKPNECFHVMMISTSRAYESTELEVSPVPPLSE